jgi:hypothetical protein
MLIFVITSHISPFVHRKGNNALLAAASHQLPLPKLTLPFPDEKIDASFTMLRLRDFAF